MNEILNALNWEAKVDIPTKNKNTKQFVNFTLLHEEIERQRKAVFQKLTEDEREEVFALLSQQYNIPEHITVKEAAEILGISEQMVRRNCANNKIRARQSLENSGVWRIETEQFMNHPNWDNFLEKCAKRKKQSIELATKILEQLDDEEEL